ncbi:MAG: hypothetical protein ACPGOY_11155 [Rhodospirillaceae bacterium]
MVDQTDTMPGTVPDQKQISDLLLDHENPRFGELDRNVEQSKLVDLIIEKFGIDDVANSLAMNGFFAAEPLVCVKNDDGKLVVKEGNRRLCACIVLTGDPRSVRQEKMMQRIQKLWLDNNKPKIEPIPVLIFEEKGPAAETMLSYLGVRHIAAAQPWDSYAKASWVARVTDDTNIPVSSITKMIGDQHSTVIRLLEGYRFIKQLTDSGNFIPTNSQRKGRGSVSEYPFSWVYTILGYKATREFCGLEDSNSESREPIPKDKIDNATTVVHTMFGDRATGKSAAVFDSRQLSDLAKAFSDSEKVRLLKTGKDLATVLDITKPIENKLEDNLGQIKSILGDLVSTISAEPPNVEVAQQHVPNSQRVRSLAVDLHRRLKDIVEGEIEDEQ